MRNKPHSCTIVTYTKNGTLYRHTIPQVMRGAEAEAYMIMNLHVGRSDIKNISWA